MTDEAFIQRAIEIARDAKRRGELPFGALLVGPDGEIALEERDRVVEFRDPTWHAETHIVKQACQHYGPDLSGYTLYTTCEPCAMCFTTAWLAGVSRIVTGTSMLDVRIKSGGVQDEMPITMQTMNQAGKNRIELTDGVLAEQCLALFDDADFTPLR